MNPKRSEICKRVGVNRDHVGQKEEYLVSRRNDQLELKESNSYDSMLEAPVRGSNLQFKQADFALIDLFRGVL